MSTSKKSIIPILIIILGFMCFTVFVTPSNAEAKTKFIRKQTVSVKSGKSETLEIKNPSKGYLFFAIYSEVEQRIKKGGVRVQLYNAKGKRVQNDYVDLSKGVAKGEGLILKFYNNEKKRLPKGTYKYKFINKTNAKITAALVVYCHTDVTKSMKLKKSITVKAGGTPVKIGKLDGAFIGIKHSTIGKKNYYFNYEDDGSIYLYGDTRGTSTLCLKLKNGKTYKCKVTVK